MFSLSGGRLSSYASLLFSLPFLVLSALSAFAQQGASDEIVVTDTRSPLPLQRSGSAISVVSSEQIATSNPGSLLDALRAVPGLDISESGGPGATMNVRLRGANTGQTLVLIDGVRVNDPGSASGEFDFSLIPPGLIDRIEVLRGPQSALYGSDAIGGVVNIITKKSADKPRSTVGMEAGSYGTFSTHASSAGTIGPWSYAIGGVGQRSDGFSRYGYRIPRITKNFPTLEADGYKQFGGFARVGYDAGQGVRLEIGALVAATQAEYDAASGTFPDTPSYTRRKFGQVWGRASFDAFDGRLTNTVTLSASRTDRSFWDVSYKAPINAANTTETFSGFVGDRLAAEYQGDLKLDAFGSLIFGGRVERETAETTSQNLQPKPGPLTSTLDASQITRSLFALWQLPVGERLNISLGGRIDDVKNSDQFATWRATVSYRLPVTETKLRASAGTGGKAPTLFQLYSPSFGTASLQSERSFGFDVGIDQPLFDGRAMASLTAFHNRFRNLIQFGGPIGCAAGQTGCYFNTARAETSGLEAEGRATIIEGWLSLSAAYTYLHSKDLLTGKQLARRAPNAARLAVQITPTAQWLIEPRLVLVSKRFSGAGETQRLAPYARLDLYTQYQINETWKIYGRVENITNARYEEVFNYGTTGRAFYAGWTATW
ncbi:TonB-dependent receptor plug domain-containing protein [Terrarubrum flagellatum]|uniref:TonB-dependent receptor plug domain-containing protein n=1 Tax=Terrirubrum flagellatum TaxID=2895980 RepID=UPI0031455E47